MVETIVKSMNRQYVMNFRLHGVLHDVGEKSPAATPLQPINAKKEPWLRRFSVGWLFCHCVS